MVYPLRDFASSYFNDIFVNCCAEGNFSNVQAHIWHLKQVFQFMQDNKLYANLKKCFFVHQKIRCWVVMRVNPEFELIRRRCHRSVLGIGVRILRNYDSGSVWQIICISILQRIMLVPYSLFHHFKRNTPRGHSFPSIKRPSMQWRRA